MSTDRIPRDHSALRRELVATVTATSHRTRSVRRGSVVALVAAFTIVGGLGGGALSAVAQAASEQPTVFDVEAAGLSFAGAAQLFGSPVILAGRGDSIIEMGTPPAGATSVAMAINCLTPGDIRTSLNGTDQAFLTCDTELRPSVGGMATYYDLDGSADQSFTIDADQSSEYVVWASWANPPEKAEPSASQRDDLEDGQITRAEYESAFDRFAQCMTEAGYPVIGIDRSETVIRYSTSSAATEAGVEAVCYDSEFAKTDEVWQLANE